MVKGEQGTMSKSLYLVKWAFLTSITSEEADFLREHFDESDSDHSLYIEEDDLRKLNRRQKKLLKEWFEKNKATTTLMFTCQELPYDLYHKMEQLNDFETLNQEIENYVYDLVSEDINKVDKQLTRG
jgi:hypothetical protein